MIVAYPVTLGPWKVDGGGNGMCFMEAEFEGETSFRVDWSSADLVGVIGVYNDKWKSIVEDREYPVEFSFSNDGEIVDQTAAGVSDPETGLKGIVASFTGVEDLAKISLARWVIVRTSNRLLEKFDLAGTKEAVSALMRCSASIGHHRTRDPFAE